MGSWFSCTGRTGSWRPWETKLGSGCLPRDSLEVLSVMAKEERLNLSLGFTTALTSYQASVRLRPPWHLSRSGSLWLNDLKILASSSTLHLWELAANFVEQQIYVCRRVSKRNLKISNTNAHVKSLVNVYCCSPYLHDLIKKCASLNSSEAIIFSLPG